MLEEGRCEDDEAAVLRGIGVNWSLVKAPAQGKKGWAILGRRVCVCRLSLSVRVLTRLGGHGRFGHMALARFGMALWALRQPRSSGIIR